jgi:tetratricopeptide (TPR) repeat protein
MREAREQFESSLAGHPRARSFLCHAAVTFTAIALCVSSPAGAQLRLAPSAPAPQPAPELTGAPSEAVTIDAPDERSPEPTHFADCVMTEIHDIGACSLRIAAERYWFVERCFDRLSKESQLVIIRACTFAIRNDLLAGPDRAYLFVNRADAYFRLGLGKFALADYNRAIKLSPRRAVLYYNRGVYYATIGDFTRARADFDSALRLDSKLTAASRMEHRLVGDGL